MNEIHTENPKIHWEFVNVDQKRVLDLGCGAGRDVYALSRMVGEQGFVIGVDMTVEQLDVAQSYQQYQSDDYGCAKSNVEFQECYI